jgi:hypothetical protein
LLEAPQAIGFGNGGRGFACHRHRGWCTEGSFAGGFDG